MARSVTLGLAGALLLVIGLLRLRASMSTRHREPAYMGLALASFGVALLLNVLAITVWVDRDLLHYSNGAILLSHLLGMVTAWAAVELAATAFDKPGRGRRLAGFGAVAVAMTFCFVLAGPRPETPLFFERYMHDSGLRPYWIVFIGSCVLATGYAAEVGRRHARHGDCWLRLSLYLIALGSALVCLFLVSRLTALWFEPAPWVGVAAIAVLATGSIVLGFGVVLPQLAATVRNRRAERRLYPLWATVTSPYPFVRESESPSSVYRAVIEIRDAVAVARSRDEVRTPVLNALAALPARASDDIAHAVDDLISVADLARDETDAVT